MVAGLGVFVSTVYPRWRGEHSRWLPNVMAGRGLSPLARGTLCAGDAAAQRGRFIPAGAGNTTKAFTQNGGGTVYPRWRGEHSFILATARFGRGEHWPSESRFVLTHGLSPLARGTLFPLAKYVRYCRFIPAGAGNTHRLSVQATGETVYPRWRGEHFSWLVRPVG